MITKLVDTLAEKLAYEERLRINHTEVNSIEATLRALQQVCSAAQILRNQLDLCTPYLGDQALASIRTNVDVVVRDLSTSQQRFATNRKEYLALHNIGEKLKPASSTLAQSWESFAQGRVAPYLDLLQLVAYLPEVAASRGDINTLVAQLREQIVSPPRTKAQLADFHEHLEQLGRLLDTIARLPEGVRLFLSRVIKKSATIADLTPEVRAWIDEGDRATAFAIIFS